MVSEEEEKKFSGKRSVGRPPKNRTIESSEGSEKNYGGNLGLRQKRTESQTPLDIVNADENMNGRASRERSSRIAMSAGSYAQSAPSREEQFAAPQSRGQVATRKRMRHEIEPTSHGISPSPSRPISDEQEVHLRSQGGQEPR